MTPPAGSRRATRESVTAPGVGTAGRGTLVLLVVAVLVVVGALALAGRAGPPAPVSDRTQTVTTPAERQVVCPGSSRDTTTYAGLLPGTGSGDVTAEGQPLDLDGGARQTIDDPPRDPVTITTTGEASRGIFATRAQDRGGVTRCGSPRASWWFTGAGANPAHSSRLVVFNPRPGPAVVDVSVYGVEGQVTSAGLRGIAVPSGERRVVELAETAPADGNLAVHVQVTRGLVVAALSDATFDVLDPQASEVPEWLPDQLQPLRHVVLDGLPPPRAVETALNVASLPRALRDGAGLVISNPGDVATVAKVRLSDANGLATPKGLDDVTVPPQSVVTVPLARLVKSDGTAIVVDADQPVTAGYVVPGTRDLVHAAPGVHWQGPAAAALPDGAVSRLILTADAADPDEEQDVPATVTVVERAADGREISSTDVDVEARTTTIRTLSKDAATVVVTSTGGVVGVVRVNRSDSFSTLPLTPVLAALRVPQVRPGID